MVGPDQGYRCPQGGCGGRLQFSLLVPSVMGPPWWGNGWDIKGRVPRQVPGEGVFLGEKANLEFLDLIRKQLGSLWGGVAWRRTEPLGQRPALQKKAWRGARESDLAKTQNSIRPLLSASSSNAMSFLALKDEQRAPARPKLSPCHCHALVWGPTHLLLLFWETEQALPVL